MTDLAQRMMANFVIRNSNDFLQGNLKNLLKRNFKKSSTQIFQIRHLIFLIKDFLYLQGQTLNRNISIYGAKAVNFAFWIMPYLNLELIETSSKEVL